ncbi:hypothetical protein AB5N19_05200 [Seiridium cardinale]
MDGQMADLERSGIEKLTPHNVNVGGVLVNSRTNPARFDLAVGGVGYIGRPPNSALQSKSLWGAGWSWSSRLPHQKLRARATAAGDCQQTGQDETETLFSPRLTPTPTQTPGQAADDPPKAPAPSGLQNPESRRSQKRDPASLSMRLIWAR